MGATQAALRLGSPHERHPPADAGRQARDALRRRFDDRLVVRGDLNRRLVSYQANKDRPGLRWFKYKEGFSAQLVHDALDAGTGPVLDPFAGIGTTVLIAGGARRRATGIEIMPIGARVARAISHVAECADLGAVEKTAARLLRALSGGEADAAFRFPHVRITARAFPPKTEDAIAKARAFLSRIEDEASG